MSGGVKVRKGFSLLPVTALEFCTISGTLYLLAGEGPYLKVYSVKSRSLLGQAELLPFCRIHGIRPSPAHELHPHHPQNPATVLEDDDGGDSGGHDVLVFGQKKLRIVELTPIITDHNLSFRNDGEKGDVLELDDWILDVCWLLPSDRESGSISGSEPHSLATVTAHNSVHIIQWSKSGATSNVSVVATYHSEVNCILYSARLQDGHSDLTVVSGTVFNQILLWCLSGFMGGATRVSTESGATGDSANRRERVCLSLIGHEGVIFSVRLSSSKTQLVSVSDDRTVRVWNLPPQWKSMERAEVKTCSLVLYGHTARVWDARLLPDYIVSIGEDAVCRVWDYSGRCVRTLEGHRGRNIWSMAVDNNSGLVVTGGGDCSIRIFTLSGYQFKNCTLHNSAFLIPESGRENGDGSVSVDTVLPSAGDASEENKEKPGSVELLDNCVLCLSNTGSLYAGSIPARNIGTVTTDETISSGEGMWRLIFRDERFSGYSLMTLCPNSRWLALGSLHGWISLLQLPPPPARSGGEDSVTVLGQSLEWRAHLGKVFSLTWLGEFRGHSDCLLSCGPDGEMIMWGVCGLGDSSVQSHPVPLIHLRLPISKHRWVMAAILTSPPPLPSGVVTPSDVVEDHSRDSKCSTPWLVCGDRKGSLHVYQTTALEQQWVEPLQSLRGIHGSNGVTHISSPEDGVIVSTGRDGHSRSFSLNHQEGLKELSHSKLVKGMDWLEQQFHSRTSHHHLVLGFHATDMVLYSVTDNRELMRIVCGGGHRSYAITALSQLLEKKEAMVVYIKKSIVAMRKVDLSSQLMAPILQEGFVGREAVSLCVVHSNQISGDGIVAVGSEDCSVCLLRLRPSTDNLSLAFTDRLFLQGHISTVRSLSTSPSCHSSSSSSSVSSPTLLFSGGARASLKVWRINSIGGRCSEGRSLEVALEAEVSVHDDPARADRGRKRTKKKRKGVGANSLSPECRVMSLSSLPLSHVTDTESTGCRHHVAAGCSDGIIREYVYDEAVKTFCPLEELAYHNHCILTVKHLALTSARGIRCVYLLSAATDGQVAVWSPSLHSLSQSGTKSRPEDHENEEEPREMGSAQQKEPLAVCRAHQSGINDLAIQQVESGGLYCVVATVGDDNALTILGLSAAGLIHTPRLNILATNPSAHSSSITGVSFLDEEQLVTSSIDQRLNIWKLRLDEKEEEENAEHSRLQLVHSITHNIADVSSLTLYHWQHRGAVLILCGIGIQQFIIETHSSRK